MFENYLNSKECYIIAEVGQNHQGDLETAKHYITEFSRMGANAVKFQMRNNKYLFSERAFHQPYNSNNAFASTYGEHRNFLEFNYAQWEEIRNCCIDHKVDFMCTPFDELSLKNLKSLNVDILKVASFDLGNLTLLSKICDMGKPIVVSVGGGNFDHITQTVEYLQQQNADFSLLHCVSEYPCPIEKLGLNNISNLKQSFPKVSIGLSDHFNGTLSGPIGYMLGARVFEKHVTFNHANKGTDHSFALEPRGFEKFVRDIKRVPQMQVSKKKEEIGTEAVFKKLGKSLCAVTKIAAGEKFTIENLRGIIDLEEGIPVREVSQILNKNAKCSYDIDDLINIEELNDAL